MFQDIVLFLSPFILKFPATNIIIIQLYLTRAFIGLHFEKLPYLRGKKHLLKAKPLLQLTTFYF